MTTTTLVMIVPLSTSTTGPSFEPQQPTKRHNITAEQITLDSGDDR